MECANPHPVKWKLYQHFGNSVHALRFAVSVAMVMAEAITTVLHIDCYIIVKHLLTKILPPFRLCFMQPTSKTPNELILLPPPLVTGLGEKRRATAVGGTAILWSSLVIRDGPVGLVLFSRINPPGSDSNLTLMSS